MFKLEVEVLAALFLPESADGSLPDTYVDVTVLSDQLKAVDSAGEVSGAPPALPVSQSTSLVLHSREPKWNERLVFEAVRNPARVSLRLLERPADLKAQPRLLGEHILSVGGLRRHLGCAWLAMKTGVLGDESPMPIPDTLCLRVLWNHQSCDGVAPAARDQATNMNAAYLTTTTIVRQPSAVDAALLLNNSGLLGTSGVGSLNVNGPQTNEALPQSSAPIPDDAVARLLRLEERVDHLDSLFRTRRDYEAEVQRVLLEQASKFADEAKLKSSASDEVPSTATTPSAAVALLVSQTQRDLVSSVQPKIVSVGATTSPYHAFQNTKLVAPASLTSHFPLKPSPHSAGSALQNILLQPTVLSSQDRHILDSSTFKHVELPKVRLIGFTPAPLAAPLNPAIPALRAVPIISP